MVSWEASVDFTWSDPHAKSTLQSAPGVVSKQQIPYLVATHY